jgi:hypothetical protein
MHMLLRSVSFTRFALLVALLATLPSCGNSRKACHRVTGELFVDGKPAVDAFIYLHPVDGSEDPKAVRPFGQADENGAFALSSYVTGDGAPAGEYIVTFDWPERSGMFKQNFDGPDRLKGKYRDPKTSQFQLTIEKKENQLPRYDLTTK